MTEPQIRATAGLTRQQATALIVALVLALLALTAIVTVWLTTRATQQSGAGPGASPQTSTPEPPSPSASQSVAPSAATVAPTGTESPEVAVTQPARPVAVGQGRPDCSGPCTVAHRLTKSLLPAFSGEQTLLLATGDEPDENGELLHAFLVDGQGRVIWEDHGFGWEWQRVDERFAIRFDEGGHVFFRAFVADSTYLYVLHATGSDVRLVGARDVEPSEGFPDGEVVERPGAEDFSIRTSVLACPEGADPNIDDCPVREALYEWNQSRYVQS